MQKKHGKKKQLSGYRLHLKRLGFSGSATSTRTIKYQLGNHRYRSEKGKLSFKRSDQENDLRDLIKYDYEKLYGAFNFKTYLDNSGDIYSLKEFWLDLLRAGVIMKHNGRKLLQDLRIIAGKQDRIDQKQQQLMQKVNPQFLKIISFDKLKKEVLLKGPFRSNRSKTVLDIFHEDNEENRKLTEEILAKTVGTPGVKQDKFWLDHYGVDKSLYSMTDSSSTTFCLLPQIEFRKSGNEDPAQLIDNFENDIKDLFGPEIKIEEYIGLSDNQGGLSQAFNKLFKPLLEGQIAEIQNIFKEISPGMWRGREKELSERLMFLSRQAQKLGSPKLVESWADYHTDFGGKIQSWISTRQHQDNKIAEALFGAVKKDCKNKYKNIKPSKIPRQDRSGGHKEDLREILRLEVTAFPHQSYETEEFLDRCLYSAASMEKHLNDWEEQFSDTKGFLFIFEVLEDYRELLADLRTNLIFLYQAGYANTSGVDSKKSANKEYKALFKELQRVPSFIGYVKSEPGGVYERYFNSLNRLQVGFQFVNTYLRQDFKKQIDIHQDDHLKYEDDIRKSLQTLLGCYRQVLVSSKDKKEANVNISKQIIVKVLDYFLIDGTQDLKNKHYIHQSHHKKQQLGEESQVNLKFSGLGLIEKAPELIGLLDIHWGKYNDVSRDLDEWLVFNEIEKVRTGLLARFYNIADDIPSDAFTEELKEHFPKVQTILERFKNKKLDSKNLNTVIQQAILSEIRGTLSKMTVKSLIARYVVQPIKSEKKFKLVTDVDSYAKLRSSTQNYYINYESSQKTGESEDNLAKNAQDLYYFKDKKINQEILKIDKKMSANNLIKLNSSKYQIQFLDNALSGKWATFKPTLSSYSLIYEEILDISWDNRGIHVSSNDPYRLFVAIPFKVTGNDDQKRIEKEKKLIGHKLLGIDVGEYGLATYILDTNNFSQSSPLTSFIENRALQLIREQIVENKSKQRAGTFSLPSTHLKRLRKVAVTEIRNRVHAVAIKNLATPVYEYNIDNFETGSGRVSKVYKSVKQSDVYRSSGTNKLERKLIWGDRNRAIALEISAYATSYSCSKCFKTIFALNPDDEYCIDEVRASSKTDYLLKIRTNDALLYGFTKDTKWQKGDMVNFENVKSYCRKYARPPYKYLKLSELNLDGSLLNKHYARIVKKESLKSKEGVSEADKIELVLKYYAGAQAVFRCPFVDCNKLADADLQAALWIALKGYVKHLTDILFDDKKRKGSIYRKLSSEEEGALSGVYGRLPLQKSDIKFIDMGKLLEFAREKSIQHVDFDMKKRLPAGF